MAAETADDGVIIERIAALDIGKAEVACCVRAPRPERVTSRLAAGAVVGHPASAARRWWIHGVVRRKCTFDIHPLAD